ncbi:MAG: LppP/LprE family lipoprotein [Solirubrobacteraceae bacterium]
MTVAITGGATMRNRMRSAVATSRARRPWTALAALAAGALALGGCGSAATKTVSVSSAAPPETTTQRTTTTRTTPSSPTTTTPATTVTTSTTPSAAETTRTTTAPAFTKQPTTAEGLGAALATVKAHGYTASDTSVYHPEQTLRVLVGTREGASEGHGQQAFFFVDGRYLGTDTKEPSATVNVVSQSDTEVTLAYPLYQPHDSLCCPGGGQATVHFQLNNGQLVALNPIPPASSQTGLSRQ